MPFERQPPRDSSDLSGNQFEERQFEERQPPWENPEMVVEKALDDLALVSEKALDDLALANETLVSMPSTKLKGERYGIGVKFQRLESGCMEVLIFEEPRQFCSCKHGVACVWVRKLMCTFFQMNRWSVLFPDARELRAA
jgi:hypothetical protein